MSYGSIGKIILTGLQAVLTLPQESSWIMKEILSTQGKLLGGPEDVDKKINDVSFVRLV
jgi:hypothetical protein